MSGPEPDREQRRDKSTQILAILDLVNVLVRALLGIFGKRSSDK